MLTPERFEAFFSALHGHAPYPWQSRLARRVLSGAGWPEVLDLPTGSGKTATLDVAVYALAAEAHRPVSQRTAPRRVVMVVDRRLIVDQAYARAQHIAERLAAAQSGVLAEVAEALRSLSGEALPLETAILRGGLPRDDHWARTPHRPVLAVSTVDQVGSRLLFRGYGVSDRMKPIHAGLLGNDALLLLDEVHLSQPFAETLEALRRRHLGRADAALPLRWQAVSLSATPGAASPQERFSLQEADRAHPRLARVLEARKPTRLVEVPLRRADDPNAAVAAAAVQEALTLVGEGLGVVGVVLNRVAAAQAAWRALEGLEVDRALLTGRMRPFDRDALLEHLLPRVAAGRVRGGGERPLVVVATQCIEAGADLDFDGLVSECASLDALRQRFGRLDRRGEAPKAAGVVLARSDQVGARPKPDPIYGDALAATWSWLLTQDPLDFGITALAPPEDAALLAPRPQAPVLLPAHVDAWVRTSPVPAWDPEVALWLHGPRSGAPDVRVVWRADVDAIGITENASAMIGRLLVAPPGAGEAVSVSLWAAWAWLCGAAAPDMSDVQGGEVEAPARGAPKPRPALIWRGEDSLPLTRRGELRPGDTLVVPARYGGLGGGSWDPQATTAVPDLGDRVQLEQRGRPTLRLHPEVLAPWLGAGTSLPRRSGDPDQDLEAELSAWLQAPPPVTALWLSALLEILRLQLGAKRRRDRPRLLEGDDALVVIGARVRPGETQEASTEDDSSAFTGREVPLAAHSAHVEGAARAFGERVGLPKPLVDDLALAGWLHDVGKADPRFQQMLVGGSAVRLATLDAPLAKSSAPPGQARARALAQARAGYPRGLRHELVSLVLVREQPELEARANDWELVLHLVSSHHGWCRPFAPPVADPAPVSVSLEHGDVLLEASSAHGQARLDAGTAERFAALNQRYGPWGLAWLEAILRLADHRASEAEQSEEGTPWL